MRGLSKLTRYPRSGDWRFARGLSGRGSAKVSMGSILPQLAAKYSVAATPEGLIYDTAPGLGDRRSLIAPSQQDGRAFLFDGSNDRVNCPQITMNGDFEIELKFRTTRTTNQGLIADSHTSTYYINCAFGTNQINVWRTGGVLVFTVPNLADNLWHTLKITLVGTTLRLWTDGVEAVNSPQVLATPYNGPISWDIGNANSASVPFWGYIKDVSVFNEGVYKLRYTCEDRNPKLALDSSGYGRHGIKEGIDVNLFHYEGVDVPTSYENEVGFSDDWTFVSNASDNVALSSNVVLPGEFDIEWESFFYEYDAAGRNMICATASLDYILWGTGSVSFRINNVNASINYDLPAQVDITRPHVYRATRDSLNVIRFYIDGVLQSQTQTVAGVFTISHLLGRPSTYSLEGWIKYFKIEGVGYWGTDSDWQDTVGSNHGTKTSGIHIGNIPAATESTDALGGALTYRGRSPMDAVAKQGWGFNFDGSDDVITLPNFVNTSLLSQGRASIRFETTYGGVISENRRLFEFGNSNKRVGVFMGAGKLNLFVTNGAASNWRWIVTADTFNDGSYHLVEVAWGDEYWIKVDGRAVAVTQTTSGTPPGSSVPLDNNDPLLIADHVAAGAFNFNGRLCDFRAYDNTGKLYTHLPIAEGEGSAVAFDVVSGKAGYFTGASVGIGGTGWVRQDVYHYNLSSGFDSALVLNGVDGYLDTGLSFYYWPEFTVWQRSMFLSTSGYDLDGFWASAHRVRLGRFSNSTGWFANFASSVDRSAAGNWLPNFSWRGLAMAGGKGIGTQLYINNTVAYNSSDWVADIGTTKTYFIGASNDSGDVPLHFANKLCAEYRIYQRKLTAEEIRWLNSNGAEGDDPGTDGLKRHYDFTRGHMYDLSPENAGAAAAYGGVSFVRVPSSAVLNNDGLDPIQPYKSNLPGVHNGAEQELDLTGGVAAPLSNARVNSSTHELVTYQSSLVATGEMQDEFGRTLPTRSFIESTANDYHQATTGASGLYSFVAGKYYTLTVYAKELAANPNKRYLILIPAATRNAFAASQMGSATFDLETGEMFLDSTGHCVWADAKNIGGGYWRLSCAVKVVITQQAANTVRFSPVLNTGADTDPEAIYVGDGQSGFELSEVMLYDGLYYPGPLMPLYLTNQSPPTAFRMPESLDNPMFTRTVTKDGRVHVVDQIVRFRVPLMGAQLQTAIEFYRDPKNTRLDNFKRPNREVVGDHWIQASERSKVTTGKVGSSAVANQVVSLHKLPIPTVNPMVEVEVSGWNGEAAGCVMFSNQNASSYYAFIAKDSATDTYGVYRWTGARLLPVGPLVSTAAPAEPFLMRAEIRYGVMRGYIDDRLVIERDVSDPDLSGDSYVGVYYE